MNSNILQSHSGFKDACTDSAGSCPHVMHYFGFKCHALIVVKLHSSLNLLLHTAGQQAEERGSENVSDSDVDVSFPGCQ